MERLLLLRTVLLLRARRMKIPPGLGCKSNSQRFELNGIVTTEEADIVVTGR